MSSPTGRPNVCTCSWGGCVCTHVECMHVGAHNSLAHPHASWEPSWRRPRLAPRLEGSREPRSPGSSLRARGARKPGVCRTR